MRPSALGPLLIAMAALLWASDAVFRVTAIHALDPTFVVTVEHLICLLIMTPWILIRRRKQLLAFKPGQWVGLGWIGMGGSALATVLFTASFRYVDPSVTILLQKLQPIIVVFLAFVFLKERPLPRFYGWATLALLSGAVLSFPDFGFACLTQGLDPRSRGVVYASAAAGLWALSTVIGKALLKKTAPDIVTFWRYVFGFGMLLFLLIFSEEPLPISALRNEPVRNSLLYMSLGPGLLSLLLYYNGLARTSASIATLVELIFPVVAILINAVYLNSSLNPTQLIAGALLLFSVTKVTASTR